MNLHIIAVQPEVPVDPELRQLFQLKRDAINAGIIATATVLGGLATSAIFGTKNSLVLGALWGEYFANKYVGLPSRDASRIFLLALAGLAIGTDSEIQNKSNFHIALTGVITGVVAGTVGYVGIKYWQRNRN